MDIWDRSCYNAYGDTNAHGRAVIAERARILALIHVRFPEARTCYFPVEGKWTCYLNLKDDGGFFSDAGLAIEAAYNRMNLIPIV